MQDSGYGDCGLRQRSSIRNPIAPVVIILALFASMSRTACALDLPEVIAGLQQRYSGVNTIKGSFVQTYRAPGVLQEESGEFWLKRPGLMRWEYRAPLEQLFVADGREFFLYVPEDRRVTVQPLTAADLHNTPLDLLLGSGTIDQSFIAAWDTGARRKLEGTVLIRLTPRSKGSEYSFLVTEIDSRSLEIRRIVIHEPGGSTSEFVFSNVVTNAKLDKKLFQFKFPKRVEVVRSNDEQ